MDFTPTSIVAICVALPLVDLIAVGLRFWVRLRVHPNRIGVDDWLILGAFVFLLGDTADLIVGTVLGLQGRYYDGPLPPDRSAMEEKTDHVMVIIEKPLYTLMKLSVLFFFRRIFLIRRSFRIASNILIIFLIIWGFVFTIAEISFCNGQPTILWDPSSQTGLCANHRWLDLIFAITDVIGDILVIVLPYPYIRQLKVTSREKVGITSIFLLGTLSTAASVVRLVFIGQAFNAVSTSSATHSTGTPPAVWSMIEAAVGVLAACLPPLGPLLRKIPSMKEASASIFCRLKRPSKRFRERVYVESHKLQEVRSSETMVREYSRPQVPASAV